MSADRELFNRREVRRTLGSRVSRRNHTKTRIRRRNRDGSVTFETRARPRARLNQKIETIRRENA